MKLGLGILCWKSPKSLTIALEALCEKIDIARFEDAVIFFQEISEADRQIAKNYGFRAEGNDCNVGILGGMKATASAVRSDVVLYLECDLLVTRNAQTIIDSLDCAQNAIASGQVSMMRMRNRFNPGQGYCSKKFLRYWFGAELKDSFVRKIRRFLRPKKAKRLIGTSLYIHKRPERIFPRYIEYCEGGFFKMDSSVINWTNMAIMFNKQWFLDTLIPYAESNLSSRTVNGYPDLEKELNCSWWRRNKFKIGCIDDGLFTHKRLDRPIEDEKSI